MTTALALLARPVIISTGERSSYRLANESAHEFSSGLGSVFEIFQEIPELAAQLSNSLRNEQLLDSAHGPLRLCFNPYHGFFLNAIKGSVEFKRIVNEANIDLISSKWQC
jgi:hypothetical protein